MLGKLALVWHVAAFRRRCLARAPSVASPRLPSALPCPRTQRRLRRPAFRPVTPVRRECDADPCAVAREENMYLFRMSRFCKLGTYFSPRGRLPRELGFLSVRELRKPENALNPRKNVHNLVNHVKTFTQFSKSCKNIYTIS